MAKSLLTELKSSQVQSAWRFMGERVRVVELAVYCNYFSKNKKRGMHQT